MIVTRQRRKPFPWKRFVLPVTAIALVMFAFAWEPSRNVIANGRMAPVWRASESAYGALAKPFSFAAQNELLTQKNSQIAALQKQIGDVQTQMTAKDKKIADLTAQTQQEQLRAVTAKPVTQPVSAPVAGEVSTSQTSGSDLAGGASPDMRRTAAFWGNMEPENAAKVIQELPVPYAARVMALMSPDAVGAILDALPPAYAAKLTQDHPELKK